MELKRKERLAGMTPAQRELHLAQAAKAQRTAASTPAAATAAVAAAATPTSPAPSSTQPAKRERVLQGMRSDEMQTEAAPSAADKTEALRITIENTPAAAAAAASADAGAAEVKSRTPVVVTHTSSQPRVPQGKKKVITLNKKNNAKGTAPCPSSHCKRWFSCELLIGVLWVCV
jgi:hypothetical protein